MTILNLNSNLAIQHVSYVSEMHGHIFPDLEIREEQQQVPVRFIRGIERIHLVLPVEPHRSPICLLFFCAIVVVVIATHVLLFELRD